MIAFDYVRIQPKVDQGMENEEVAKLHKYTPIYNSYKLNTGSFRMGY